MDLSDKNIYENIINFADNRTVLQMLSVNKRFSDPIFFERVIDRKYPLLKELKKEDESWRRFFIRMTYYIAKLDEEFGIPYIPSKGYDPEGFYKLWNKSKYIYNQAMAWAAYGGHLDIVKYLIKKGKEANKRLDFNDAMADAARGGHLDIVKYMIKKGADDFNYAIYDAVGGGHPEIVEYLKQFV